MATLVQPDVLWVRTGALKDYAHASWSVFDLNEVRLIARCNDHRTGIRVVHGLEPPAVMLHGTDGSAFFTPKGRLHSVQALGPDTTAVGATPMPFAPHVPCVFSNI